MHAVFRSLGAVVTLMTLLQPNVSVSETLPEAKTDSGDYQLVEAEFCPVWIGQSARLNGRDLAGAALGCLREGKPAEAGFLMIAGQIRLQVDSITHVPVDDSNRMNMEKLSELLPPSREKSLLAEVFGDPVEKDRFVSLLESWKPVFFEGYNPGWEYISHIENEQYRELLLGYKAYRAKTIERYATQLVSDEFQALERELLELVERSGGSLSDGSEEKRQARQLLDAMNKIANGVESSLVAPERSDRFHYEPDLNSNFIQRHQGRNGPVSADVFVFTDEKAVRSSWLARALSEETLDRLISDTDFEDQILVAFAAGEQDVATGSIYVTGIAYDSRSGSLRVTGKVGVVTRGCPVSATLSYPFAVAAAIRPNGKIIDADLSAENVADGCRAPVAGRANN